MLAEIAGVVKVLDVVPVAPARATPPVSAAYHDMVPAEAVAPKVTVPGPTLDPGVVPVIVGVIIGVTAKVCAVPVPHVFEGVTVIVPEFPLVVTVTELLVPPAVCDQPDGNDQVYVVPATLVTL